MNTPNDNTPPAERTEGSLERVVSQLREWEQAAFERSQDQTRKTDEQAYHLGKKDAYEMVRLAIERAKQANDQAHRQPPGGNGGAERKA